MNIRTAINDYVEIHRIENHSDWTVSHRLEHLTWFADWLETTHGITDTNDLRVIYLFICIFFSLNSWLSAVLLCR